MSTARTGDVPDAGRDRAAALGWAAGFYVALWAVGLLAATATFTLLYLRVASREPVRVAALYSAASVVFVHGLFGVLLRIDLPAGVL